MSITRQVNGAENRQKQIPVAFTTDGSSVPTLKVGKGVTVTKLLTGKIKVQLDRVYPRSLGVTHGKTLPGAAAPADGLLTIDDTNITVDGSLIVWTALVAAPTTAANLAASVRVDLTICVSESDT